jgi:hypothetical protein
LPHCTRYSAGDGDNLDDSLRPLSPEPDFLHRCLRKSQESKDRRAFRNWLFSVCFGMCPVVSPLRLHASSLRFGVLGRAIIITLPGRSLGSLTIALGILVNVIPEAVDLYCFACSLMPMTSSVNGHDYA